MKICFIGYNLLPDYHEGVRKNTYEIIWRLQKRGHKVFIITSGGKDKVVFYKNIKIYSVGVGQKGNIYSLLINAPRFIKKARRILLEERPIVIYDRFVLMGSSLLTLFASFGLRIVKFKTVFNTPIKKSEIFDSLNARHTLFEVAPRLSFDNPLLWWLILKRFEKVIVVCSFLEKKIEKYSQKVIYLPEGVDYQKFAGNKVSRKKLINKYFKEKNLKNKRFACYLGHPAYKKGIDYLLGALPLILEKQKDFFFIFALSKVGETGEVFLKKISQLCRENKNMVLLGVVDPVEIFLLSDVFILPMIYSWGAIALPNTILEAMAAGTVVISTPMPGIKEVLNHKKTGFLVASRSSKEIERAITWCLENFNQAKAIGRKGQLLVEKYDWGKIIDEHERLLKNYESKKQN